MPEQTDASPWAPERPSPGRLRDAVQECPGCDLSEGATLAVFSTGAQQARVMLVGAQPGDQEDGQDLRTAAARR